MEAAILAALTTLFTVIETVLPAISASTAAPTIIAIVGALEKWLPIVLALFPSATTILSSIQNMIAALSSNPATPAAQLATLQTLDAQVDAAFNAIALSEDPDAVSVLVPTVPPAPATPTT